MSEPDEEDPPSQVLSVLRERLRSPFFGAVAVAWVFLNWRPLAVLFVGALPIADRIALADREFILISRTVVYPILFGAGYVLVYPWISLALHFYRGFFEQKIEESSMRRRKFVADLERDVTQPAWREISHINRLAIKNREEIEAEIVRLKGQAILVTATVEDLKRRAESLKAMADYYNLKIDEAAGIRQLGGNNEEAVTSVDDPNTPVPPKDSTD